MGSKLVRQFVARCQRGSTIYDSDRNGNGREILEKLSLALLGFPIGGIYALYVVPVQENSRDF